jgi:hypothetical protein
MVAAPFRPWRLGRDALRPRRLLDGKVEEGEQSLAILASTGR